MNRKFSFLAFVALCAAALIYASAQVATDDLKNFLTRRGDKLFDGDREYRFISFNIPNLMVIEDAYEFTHPNPWRWPNDFEIEDSLESVRQMGGQVVRTYVLSVHRDGSDMGDCVHVRRPGEFNEEGFRALDKVIEVAHRKGIRVIIPFVDQAKWWGGVGEYAAFRGKQLNDFWTDPQIMDDFKATIRHLLTRKNTYTGVEYRNDPTIFGWETGNEILPTPAWTREIAAYVKQLDKNHLVIDGKSLRGVPIESLNDPNVDVITTHHYPFGEDHDFAKPIRDAHALTKGKKAFFVGEFGFVEMPYIAGAIQAAIDDGTSGALLWSLRMHRREGGFYWHMEVGTGRNIYKAFHWPGFASGDRYDERAVMKLVRDKAYEIRGLKPPAAERPEPPKLLPIEKASAISWQGSAGASSYDVWRAEAAAGPWNKIAKDVSDADVQYRPLFNDDSAMPGTQYWYRIVARNSAGDSEPSQVVGPVAVKHRELVDECRDLSLTLTTEGNVSPASDNARTVQEDCYRLTLRPGSSIIYRLKGPIKRWRLYSFGAKDVKLEFSVSADGKNFRSVSGKREAYPSSQTVYGYATPIQFSGDLNSGKDNYLKIAFGAIPDDKKSQDAADKTTATKSELIELSRVEIEYGGTPTPKLSKNQPPAKTATQLNSSVFIDQGHPLDETLRAIDAAAKRGERQLNVVVTVLVDLTNDLHIKSFGELTGEDRTFRPYDDGMRAELKKKMHDVFARMVQHNMSIYILPHVDAGSKVRRWRNWVVFDPLEAYGGYTYAELVLGTIAEALDESTKPDTNIELALSGEMGKSLFQNPEQYRKVVGNLRTSLGAKRFHVGISLNHNDVAGNLDPRNPKDLPLSTEKRQQMQALIDESDFVGVSCYASVSIVPTKADFVRGIDRFMEELRQKGLTVPNDKPLQVSEVGFGGGHLKPNQKPDPAKAVESPWAGTDISINNPWTDDGMRLLRRQFHSALLDFLDEQPLDWPITAAFIWSSGPWDPISLGQPALADQEIIEAIEKHNRTVANPR